MRHKTKNRLIKKRKGRKTIKRNMRMRRGGSLFGSMQIGIPGLGSVGTCPDKQIYEDGVLKTQTCTVTPVGEIYKTQNPDSGAATEKSWYDIF